MKAQSHERMLLTYCFDDPNVNIALELFLRMIRDDLGEWLLSVLLYGSILFDDLSPGYGDLDFLAVVADDLDEPASERLTALRAPLRSGEYGLYCQMIEGAFLPANMLSPDAQGKALWWGTTSERLWHKNQLGPFVLHTIREQGLVIWGEDLRRRIPKIRKHEILQELLLHCTASRAHSKPTSLQCLDFLLTPARELLWLKTGKLSSKSEAADWGYRNAKGEWRKHLPRAKFLRRNPQAATCGDVQEWIRSLEPSILDATDELEREVKRAMEREESAISSNRH